jgi:hypothetical protein
MKMQDIKKIAENWNVSTRLGRTKAEVIRDIQVREGFTPCYGITKKCGQTDCLWKKDCLK